MSVAKNFIPSGEKWAAEIAYGPKGGFYLYESKPTPPKPVGAKVAMFGVMDKLGLAHEDGIRRSIGKAVMKWIDSSPSRAESFEQMELSFKKDAFGCQNCGNCILGEMEYVCRWCPKNLRNGPCGGPLNGMCEVTPEQPCIWVSVYERAKAHGTIDHLKTFIPARRRDLSNTSSYINFYLDRDNRPENAKPLVQISGGEPKVNVP
ncbi:MAG: methylenetetrahydrofolate reductase C-terminal domain-containing protein [Acidobacteriota bacterium]